MELYHGTGAKFDHFSNEHINTGEEVQRYGYGIYLTDSIDVARFYANRAAGTGYVYTVRVPNSVNLVDWDESIDPYTVSEMAKKIIGEDALDEVIDDMQEHRTFTFSNEKFEEIIERLLVDGADNNAWEDLDEEVEDYDLNPFRQLLSKADFQFEIDSGINYEVVYKYVSDAMSPQIATNLMKAFGIDGFKFPSNELDGAMNYTIFDANNIKVLDVAGGNMNESTMNFKTFVESLKRKNNVSLIEAIMSGYSAIFESSFSGKELVVVDIQPEYECHMIFRPYEFTVFLNEHNDYFSKFNLFFNCLYLGMVSESEYSWWLIENGLEEETLDRIHFFDKGYNFFRNAMDHGIDHDEIVHVIAFMAKNDINDSRDLDDDMWSEFAEQFPDDEEVVEFLKDNEDAIFIPELIDELDDAASNLIVTGGGRDECLAEVLIALKYLGKQYQLLNEFVY